MTGSEPQGDSSPAKAPVWFVKGFWLLFLGLFAQAVFVLLLFVHHKLGLRPRLSDGQFEIALTIFVILSIFGWTFVMFLKVSGWMGLSLFGKRKSNVE